MRYILALDQGTTSSRAIVFDAAGKIRGRGQKEFGQHFPRSGWVEHDAAEIWSTQIGTAQEALANAGVRAADIAAIGITNQRETVVVWDKKTGKAVHHAIVWQDRRTAQYCDALRERGLESTIRSKTGLLIDPYFSSSKLAWLLENVAGLRERAEAGELAFGTIDSWLVYNLTGGALHLTDATNACRTQLYNIHTGNWDDELLDIFGVPRAMLPELRSSSEIYGETDEGLFGSRVPIAGIAGDQQAATFGQACLTQGMVKNTYGTGCFMLLNTGSEPVASEHKLLTTVAWQRGQQRTFALEGGVFVAGAVVQWLRDGLGIIRHSSDVESLATSVPDNGGVYFVPAFTGLGAPHWDAYARGTLVGLTRGSTSGHIARAALEAIAYQVAELLGAMREDAQLDIPELRVDGGASANDLLMQFQADILGIPVVRPEVTETTALGAAYLAGLAVGYWQDEREITDNWAEAVRFEPRMDPDERDALLGHWRRAVEHAKGWDR